MRKLIVSTLVTLDGVYGDPRSWAGPYFDDEAAESSLALLRDSDAMLMGRVTYEYFAGTWPAATGPYADRVNGIRKWDLMVDRAEHDALAAALEDCTGS